MDFSIFENVTTPKVHIHVSAKNPPDPGYMPFEGRVGLWVYTTQHSQPTSWNPDYELYWYTDDPNPTLTVDHGSGLGTWYLWWRAEQTTAVYPPNDWELRTQWYSGTDYDDEYDFTGNAIFEQI